MGERSVDELLAAMGREADASFRRYMGAHHVKAIMRAAAGELDWNGFERDLYLAAGRFFSSYQASKGN